MSDRKPPMPPAEADLDARVAALEQQMAHVSLGMTALDQRVDALEDAATVPPRPDQGLPEQPLRPDHTLPPVEPPTLPPVTETALLMIELDLPGGVLTFIEDEAVDVGDYVGEFVHQRCLAQRQGPWTVFFRPDADGSRDEVIVEYGAWDFSTSPPTPLVAPAHVGVYTAFIRRGDEQLASVAVPAHYWLTRWRWQSAPRPVVRTAADLVAMTATLPLSESALWNSPASHTREVTWSGPMGTAGLTTAMGTTGDRQEIGPLTDLQACFLLRGNDEARDAMLAQAEAVGSFPFWVRDPATHSLLDIFEHPNHALQTSADAAKYPVLNPVPAPPGGDYFVLDNSHFPSVAYVPWLLTDDPYFLEGAQMTALFGVIENNYNRINEGLPGLCYVSQKRGWAWAMRGVLQMVALSPTDLPGWFAPRSLFDEIAADNLEYVERGMASQIKSAAIFHMAPPQNGALAPWQEGYLLSVLGWARWSGAVPAWDAAIDWMAQVLLQDTADPALGGWDRRWPAGFWIILNRARTAAHDLSIQPPGQNIAYDAAIPEPYHDETPDSWGELWSLYQQRMALEGTPIVMGPDDRIYQNADDNPEAAGYPLNYMEIITGALGALALGGVPGAAEHQAWMCDKLPALYDSYGNPPSSFRYAYVGNAAA